MATVAVIGSNSFSGSDFIDLLLNETDYDVIGISRSPEKSDLFLPYKKSENLSKFSFYRWNINYAHYQEEMFHLFRERRPEYIINFAAQSEVAPSWDKPHQWFETNTLALAHLGNSLKDVLWLKKFVQISTPEVYGSVTGAVKEDAPMNPSTPYAASKAAGDMFLSLLHKQYGFPVVTIRSANVYGAHQQLHKIIPRTFIHERLARVLDLYGGGTIRSFIHIRDVSRGELAAMERGEPGETYHLSLKAMITIRHLVDTIYALVGADFFSYAREVEKRRGQDAAYMLDPEKARQKLSWAPMIGLDRGLAEVREWVDREWDRIRKEPLEYVHKP